MGSLPLPSYGTTVDLEFVDGADNVISITGPGSPAVGLYLVWDVLSTPDQQAVLDLIQDYGPRPGGSPDIASIGNTLAGYHTINVSGLAAAGSPRTPTGLDASLVYEFDVTYGTGSPVVEVTETVTTSAEFFDGLVNGISGDLSGATATIVDGNIQITNDALGNGADVLIDFNGSLFASGDLAGQRGLFDPRSGVDVLRDVFTRNRLNGTLARRKFTFVKLGSRPVGAPGNSIEKAYYNGSDWVRWIDDGAA